MTNARHIAEWVQLGTTALRTGYQPSARRTLWAYAYWEFSFNGVDPFELYRARRPLMERLAAPMKHATLAVKEISQPPQIGQCQSILANRSKPEAIGRIRTKKRFGQSSWDIIQSIQ